VKQVNVKPKLGCVVRDPDDNMRPLSEDGKVVNHTSYWQRRIDDGDVTVVTTTRQAKKPVDVQEAK
jgi:regulator of protease activity HflC (stomatin/prohibitin superfamily)